MPKPLQKRSPPRPGDKVERSPPLKGARKPPTDDADTHRRRFDQLLDDVVFGKPTKR